LTHGFISDKLNHMLSKKNAKAQDKQINFVPPTFDRLSLGLQMGLTYGVIATIIVIVIIVATSSYELQLQNKLSKLNSQIEEKAQELVSMKSFECKFLETQEKLELYSQISNDEKMAELFPKLAALIPDGVRVKDLIITPDQVEIEGMANNQVSLSQFATNLKHASNLVFDNGQSITVGDPNLREIVKNPDQLGNDTGYNFSIHFYYNVN